MDKIVVTGLGAITAIGNDPETFWQNLQKGVSGATRITQFDATEHPSQIACEIKDFDPLAYMPHKTSRRLTPSTRYGVAVAKQALKDAGFEITPENASRVGVVMNTGGGGVDLMEPATRVYDTKGPRKIGPFYIPIIMANAACGYVSIETGAMGPVLTSALACASGSYAFVEAYHLLQRGEADVMIAGGTEGLLSPLIVAAFGRMNALSRRNDDPTHASRPFDRDRDGFVQGDGAAAFILETEAHAKARGAHIYAELLGGSLTGDAYHITAPHPESAGAIESMRRALAYTHTPPEAVDVIYAHGTSTPMNGTAETYAIKTVFGDHAYNMAIPAIKSMVGHTLGASGPIAGVAAVLGFRDGVIPPTTNLENPGPDCDLDYVPHQARRQRSNLVMINAFGFGGQNVVFLLKRYQG